jgi:hypothetical protein
MDEVEAELRSLRYRSGVDGALLLGQKTRKIVPKAWNMRWFLARTV